MSLVIDGKRLGSPVRKRLRWTDLEDWDTGSYSSTEVVSGDLKLTESPPSTFATTGSWESAVYDSGIEDLDWGFLFCKASTTSGGTIELQLRSGASSDLSSETYSNPITNPTLANQVGRYIQLKATIEDDGTESPTLKEVDITFDATILPVI
jgi:hypothetical protein